MTLAGCRDRHAASVPVDNLPSAPPSATSPTPVNCAADSRLVHIVDGGLGRTAAHVERRQQEQASLLDPTQDGWPSEAFAEVAKHQLEALLELLCAHRRPTTSQVEPYFAPDVRSLPLRPELSLVYEDATTQVWRPQGATRPEVALLTAWIDLLGPLHEVGNVKCHVKIVRVDLQSPHPVTVALFDSLSASDAKSVQQVARLNCVWDAAESKHPRLLAVTCDDFEEVHVHTPGGKWYADDTQTILGSDAAWTQQLRYGLNHWMQRVERAHHMDDSVRNGLAVGDANGDGLDDVYCCQGPGLPNRLWLQNADGTTNDHAAAAGVDWLDQTSSALFLDLDNDGDQDLAIATTGGLLIMENNGAAQFELCAQLGAQRVDFQALTSCDYDNDGDLDLFACVYRPTRGSRRGDFVFHNATTGGSNLLFRNDIGAGQWNFHDATAESGLDDGATRYSLAAAWEDYDDDGDQDLYVANDYGRNYLYQNQQGRFRDVTELAGLSDTGFGMSVSWGDFNRDGRVDLYIGNMFSSAGSRITRQSAFQHNASPEQRAIYQRMAKGNTLFAQQADGTFRDVTDEAAVDMGRWAWSSVFADLNNDGWEDLVVANGYITSEDTGDL